MRGEFAAMGGRQWAFIRASPATGLAWLATGMVSHHMALYRLPATPALETATMLALFSFAGNLLGVDSVFRVVAEIFFEFFVATEIATLMTFHVTLLRSWRNAFGRTNP
jgi:hypothetical protein